MGHHISVSPKKQLVFLSHPCSQHTQQQEGICTCPLACFVLLRIGSPGHAGFHSFSGTFSTAPPTALNNSAWLWRLREACARRAHYSSQKRLAGWPAQAPPHPLCYPRADKGGRCEKEINVDPSDVNWSSAKDSNQ